MSSNNKNVSLTIALSAVLAGSVVSTEHTPWVPAAEAAQSVAQSYTEQQRSDAFFASQYGYNDADLLAGFWGEKSVWDAKLKIGGLLLDGNSDAVAQALKNMQSPSKQQVVAEEQKSDAFFNSDYTYDDAALLATFWGKATPWDAKLKIGSLLLSDNDAAVQQALKNAHH